ncbi:MAG: hypothetical protein H6620_12415 [Halobacteriovoraceae bacterium]|nr:hypothetical protein [Halobacteriovoraceae bacterium]
MEFKFSELKATGIKATSTISTLSRQAWTATSESALKTSNHVKSISIKLKEYTQSPLFEDDLDQLIHLLHLHNPSSKPNMNTEKDSKVRVFSKVNYVKTQAALLVATLGTTGAEIGASISGPEGAAIGFTIGTATGIILITVVAGNIVIKRILDGSKSTELILV